MTISEAFSIYDINVIKNQGLKLKTSQNYKTALSSFIRAVGDLPIEIISLDSMIVWKMDMDKRGQQPTSIRGNLIKFRSVIKYLKTLGLPVFDTRDIDMPKLYKKKPVWLNYNEVKEIIAAGANERDQAMLAMLFSTGCRISELLSLNVADVRENDEPMVCGKGDRYRKVYIDVHARKYLNDYLQTRRDNFAPLFLSGQRARITVSRVEQIVHECTLRAGIDKRVTPHVFRHSTITDLILNGAPMAHVQRFAGHQHIQTTIDIYTHLTDREAKEAHKNYHSTN